MPGLTAARVKALAAPGMHGDSGCPTLYLNVTTSGSKSWVQRLTVDGKRRELGLGGFPLVSLAEARAAALANRRLAYAGGDPLAAKRQTQVPTFREAAERTFEANAPRWRNAKVIASWGQQLERYALPILGDLRVDQIGREEVLRVLTPIWTAKPETARKLRRRIRTVLRWAMAHGYVEVNVAGEAIDGALPPMLKVRKHFRSLPYREVAGALDAIAASGVSLPARLCLRFVILTAVRSGEARGAAWTEIDLEAREWRIPAERMKAGAEHRVPLSDAAVAVLKDARPLRDDDLMFPSVARSGRPVPDGALTRILRATGLADRATVHGFRSSFRDWCAETGKPRELAEAALAHTVPGVEGAYFRSDLFERRRLLMDQWATYLIGTEADVMTLYR